MRSRAAPEQPDGLTRVYLSPEQRAASALAMQWMRDAGMNVHLDAVGNVVGRYEGDPCRHAVASCS